MSIGGCLSRICSRNPTKTFVMSFSEQIGQILPLSSFMICVQTIPRIQ